MGEGARTDEGNIFILYSLIAKDAKAQPRLSLVESLL